MIKDRRVVLRMNLLELKFKKKNLLLKMSTFVFISIKHVSEAFFFFSENLVNTDTWYVPLVSVLLGFRCSGNGCDNLGSWTYTCWWKW